MAAAGGILPRHVLIISYYELKESLLFAARALVAEASGSLSVSCYPLMQRLQESKDDFAETVRGLAETPPMTLAVLHVLWWYTGPSAELVHSMKQCTLDIAALCGFEVHHLLYNWDDPYVWFSADSQIQGKASAFDVAIVSCKESTAWHVAAGAKRAVYCLPGFDPECHYPECHYPDDKEEEKMMIDVAICCTNFYADNVKTYPDQLAPTRMQIVTALADYLNDPATDKSVFSSLAVYGPASVEAMFPDFYRGHLTYAQTRAAFARARLNLCTHVVGNRDGYLSERVSLVLGTGGLLWVDRVPQDIFTDEHVAFIEPGVDVAAQAIALLGDAPALASKRAAGHALAMEKLTWRSWAQVVLREMLGLESASVLQQQQKFLVFQHPEEAVAKKRKEAPGAQNILSIQAEDSFKFIVAKASSSSRLVTTQSAKIEYLIRRCRVSTLRKSPILAKMCAKLVYNK